MQRDDQRKLLGRFIRSHRERLPPDMPGTRRRTPGLRREELAARAGIGVTWVSWIEQGRDVRASPEALARLARALALTPAERAYLFELAERRDPAAPAAAADSPPALEAMVEALAHPAYALDRLWNACCWNRAAEHLFAGWLGKGADRNLLRYVFTHPEAHRLLPDWRERATRLLAEFRADYGRALNDATMIAFVEAMRRESSLFADAWEAQAVVVREGGERRFAHPVDGALTYDQHTFIPADRPDHKLVVLFSDNRVVPLASPERSA